jgi:hypothetical protein
LIRCWPLLKRCLTSPGLQNCAQSIELVPLLLNCNPKLRDTPLEKLQTCGTLKKKTGLPGSLYDALGSHTTKDEQHFADLWEAWEL